MSVRDFARGFQLDAPSDGRTSLGASINFDSPFPKDAKGRPEGAVLIQPRGRRNANSAAALGSDDKMTLKH